MVMIKQESAPYIWSTGRNSKFHICIICKCGVWICVIHVVVEYWDQKLTLKNTGWGQMNTLIFKIIKWKPLYSHLQNHCSWASMKKNILVMIIKKERILQINPLKVKKIKILEKEHLMNLRKKKNLRMTIR